MLSLSLYLMFPYWNLIVVVELRTIIFIGSLFCIYFHFPHKKPLSLTDIHTQE